MNFIEYKIGSDEKFIEYTVEEAGSQGFLDIETDCKCNHEYGQDFYNFNVETVHTRTIFNYRTKKLKIRNNHPYWFAIIDKILKEKLNKDTAQINREFRIAINFHDQNYWD